MRAWAALGWVAAAVGSLTGCCFGSCGTPMTPQQQAQYNAEKGTETALLRDGLAKLTAAPPSLDAPSEVPCPPVAAGSGAREVLTVDREYLAKLADPEFDGAVDPHPGWAWLRSEALTKPQRGAQKFTAEDLEGDRERVYLAVFQSADARLPVIDGAGAYAPGHYDGWLSVIDVRTQAVVCAAHFSADSSPKMQSEATGPGEVKDRQAKVDEDFQEVFEQQAKLAIERISSDLDVDFGTFN